MTDQSALYERRAQEERARAAIADDPVKATAHRRRARLFQQRANANRESDGT
jgi:hypothetical protein